MRLYQYQTIQYPRYSFLLYSGSVLTVLFSLSCPNCPALAVLSWLPCPDCPFLAALSWLSFGCAVPAILVLSRLSFLGILFWLSCSGYPVPAVLSCVACPVLCWLSCPGCPVLAIHNWLSFSSSYGSRALLQVLLFYPYLKRWQLFSCCPFLCVLFWQSYPGSSFFWLSCAGLDFLAVLSWQTCPGSPVLTKQPLPGYPVPAIFFSS
jgi:hypothetical protein